mmetsp:Transcript_85452/g.238696  ORF Transcript_85452/g.238696 Transcript_85452/m.238696 type:complete len:290 (+) Transcript_85452:507-1376(+)
MVDRVLAQHVGIPLQHPTDLAHLLQHGGRRARSIWAEDCLQGNVRPVVRFASVLHLALKILLHEHSVPRGERGVVVALAPADLQQELLDRPDGNLPRVVPRGDEQLAKERQVEARGPRNHAARAWQRCDPRLRSLAPVADLSRCDSDHAVLLDDHRQASRKPADQPQRRLVHVADGLRVAEADVEEPALAEGAAGLQALGAAGHVLRERQDGEKRPRMPYLALRQVLQELLHDLQRQLQSARDLLEHQRQRLEARLLVRLQLSEQGAVSRALHGAHVVPAQVRHDHLAL